MPDVVYRATAAASAAYEAALTAAIQARKTAVAKFLSDFGFAPDTSVYAHEEGTGRIVGVRHDGPTVPAGWRIDRKHPGSIVPALRTRHGKSVDKALAAIPHSDGRAFLPGAMPHHCIAGHVLMHPSVEVLDGRLYVGWPRELPGPVETRIGLGGEWEDIRLSEFYAARERAEEQTERSAP